jgi:hypothetical protein
MAWTISGAKSRWGALKKVEKDYVFTILTLGFAFCIGEIMRVNGLPYKFVLFICLAICLIFTLYLSFLPFLVKKYSATIPFAGLCSNLDEWEKEKSWMSFGFLWIIIMAANLTGTLKSEPFCTKAIFMIFCLIMFFFGFLYNYRKSKIIENTK